MQVELFLLFTLSSAVLGSDFAQSTGNSFTFSTEKKQNQRPNAADDQLELAMVRCSHLVYKLHWNIFNSIRIYSGR